MNLFQHLARPPQIITFGMAELNAMPSRCSIVAGIEALGRSTDDGPLTLENFAIYI
jgi:hypothetical protein